MNDTTAVNTANTRPPELPWPLAAPGTFKYVLQLVKRLVFVFAITSLVLYDYVTVYFLSSQNNLVRSGWNHAFVVIALGSVFLGTVLRHFVRDLMEAQLTSATGWVFGANPYNVRKAPKERHGIARKLYQLFNPEWLLNLLERLKIPTPRTYRVNEELAWWQWLYAVVALPFAGIIGYVIAFAVYMLSRVLTIVLAHYGIHLYWDDSHYPGILSSEIDTLKNEWQYKLGGILGTLFYARLVFRVYATELMKIFARLFASLTQWAERRDHKVIAWIFREHFFYPDGFRAAFKEAYEETNLHVSRIGVAFLIPLFIAALAFIYPGYFIITQVATHKHAFFLPGFGTSA